MRMAAMRRRNARFYRGPRRSSTLWVMHRQPHGRLIRIGPGDPVADMRWNVQGVAGPQRARRRLALELHRSRALQQHHAFGALLVVPEALGARLSGRDDALDAQIGRREEDTDLLGV